MPTAAMASRRLRDEDMGFLVALSKMIFSV
jgi:uncharacterized membrane protein YhaH (DUF805 family)